jgi:putative NADH-flavin reductase
LTILSRTSSKATFDEDVKVIKRDYSDKNLAEAFEGQDVVVSFINGAAILDQINFIDLAANAGVKRFIPSEFGSDTLNSKAQDLVFFYKQKFAVIEHARAVAEKSPHFTWTAIATGPIFDWVSHPMSSTPF